MRSSGRAAAFFSRACELRFQPACVNLLDQEALTRGAPRPLDLRLLLREGGLNLMETPEPRRSRASAVGMAAAVASRSGGLWRL